MTPPPRRWLAVGAIAAALAAVLTPATASATTPSTQYYVSLGDSLSIGIQPGPDGHNRPTEEGYADVLYASLKAKNPNLTLVKLGCSGESTTTLRHGGICTYTGASSQLDAAAKFIRAHRRQVAYVTLDIGANDVDGCATGGSVDMGCAVKGVATVAGNLPVITTTLRIAAFGGHARFVGMNYYDPVLATWLTGTSGQQTARLSVTLTQGLNTMMGLEYGLAGFRVADVAGAFDTMKFSPTVPLPGAGNVPLNVARICAWTYMCAPAPVGPNIHATPAGYQVLARAFAAQL
jgi:lysophospholipase L1-like esterase